MSTTELEVSITAWMFTDEDLDAASGESSIDSATDFSVFSFSQSVLHSSSPSLSPLTSSPEDTQLPSSPVFKRSNKAKTRFQAKVRSPIDCPPRTITDWRSYYDSLTPTSASAVHYLPTPPTLTSTPTTATTKVGSPYPRKESVQKPRLSVIIPDLGFTPAKTKERTFARKRRAVPRPLSLWDISNARGVGKRPHATSLPSSPFILVKEVKQSAEHEHLIVQTPCDILSAVEFDLQATLQSATQNVPVSVRKVRGYKDQWRYYREDTDEDEEDCYEEDEDEDYMSEPGTSMPDSAYSPIDLSPYISNKIHPTIQRGRQNPFPMQPVCKPLVLQTPNTRAARVDLLRQRYHDIKIASPFAQEANKDTLQV